MVQCNGSEKCILGMSLDSKSRDLFAFEWENPTSRRKQEYHWIVLLQGFTEAPNLFGQILERVLEEFQLLTGTQLLQYVNNLLVSEKRKDKVSETTPNLLNFLGRKGLCIPKNKLQFVEKEVK
jgi:hypothetical protein